MSREQVPFRYRAADGPMGVTRETTQRLAQLYGVDETAVIHLALSRLAREVLPQYEIDNGPLTPSQLAKARSLIDQNREPTSSLFGTTARRRPKR